MWWKGGQPYLYALALYNHSEYGHMAEMLAGLEGFEREAAIPPSGREHLAPLIDDMERMSLGIGVWAWLCSTMTS